MNAARIAAVGLLMTGILVVVEVVARRTRMAPEASRKLAHAGGGTVVALLPAVMPLPEMAVLSALFVPFFLLSRRFDLLPSIHTAERSTLGEAYFPVGILIATLVGRRALLVGCGILVMALSDAAASLVGGRLGRHPFRLPTAPKTYEGSAAFFLVTATILAVGLVATGLPAVTAVALALPLAGILTVAEAMLGWGLDNVVLPGLAAALMWLVTRSG
ncbi:MAG TPA: hypothetical protein VG245_01315 [Candidatus Dormibacteraeota bacterium]|nr:hypothetical protein [Candidatus Dormibacteraeota bacterium]